MSGAPGGAGEVRAMVLAAGLGTRLRPLTDVVPKPLVPVLGVPLLEATLDRLEAAGVTRAVVNAHHRAEALLRALGEMRASRRMELVGIEERELLGTGGGLRNAAPWLRGAAVVLLVNGDTLFDVDLAAFVAAHRASGAGATLLVRPNPDPVAFAPVWTEGPELAVRRIASLPPVPTDGLRPWLFAGVHAIDPDAIELLPPGASDVNRAMHPALLARGEAVRAFAFAGAWSDVGTPGRLLAATRAALAAPPPLLLARARRRGYRLEPPAPGGAGRTAVGAAGADGVAGADGADGADEAGAPPSLVGAGVRRGRDAAVRASVIGSGTTLGDGATVERSVVLDGATIEARARVVDSVIGPGTHVAAGELVVAQLAVAGERRRIAGGAAG